MKPRQPAIGMAQRPQRRRNPLDRRQMLGRRPPSRLGQRLRGPGQQGENLQQFLGVARRNAALARRSRPRIPAPARRRPGPPAPPSRSGPARHRSAPSAPRTAAGPVRRPASAATGTPSGATARGNRRPLPSRSRPFSSNSAWLIQRISRRPVRSGVQPGPWPRPNRAIQSQVQSCARLRAAPSPTAARSSSQAKPCTSSSKAGSGIADIPDRQAPAPRPDGPRTGSSPPPVAGRAHTGRWCAARAARRSRCAGFASPAQRACSRFSVWTRRAEKPSGWVTPASSLPPLVRARFGVCQGTIPAPPRPVTAERPAGADTMKNPSIPPRSAQ